jgi:alanine-synthesizing transaminase
MELWSSLRLCSTVPGQWAVLTALGGYLSIGELIRPGGWLYQSRQSVFEAVASSPYLCVVAGMGAMYAFVRIDPRIASTLDDRAFAQELLETRHVLIAPGSSFNTPYKDHFRITILPDAGQIQEVFDRINSLLNQFA